MTDRKQLSTSGSSRLPALGPRGEGWVVLQVVAFAASGLAGLLGPAWDGPGRVVSAVAGIVALGAGVLLAATAGWTLGSALTPVPMPAADAVLRQTGPYALARHPIYGGIVLAAIGWGLLAASFGALLVAAVILVFFDLKSRREEAWLVARFPDYPTYRARTRRLLPWVY